jgi:glycogen debranching enzyme
MPIVFERSLCCNFDETISREWLITNGLGGYAAGTVAGMLTRMQHGLLVAALDEDAVPQLLLAKIDEEVIFDQRTYYLGTNEYQDGTLNPSGFVHLESFRLEEGFPIFTYRLGGMEGIMLEKRIWMPPEQNTTYIQYRVLRTSAPQATSAGNTPVNWARRNQPGSRSYTRTSRSYGYLEERQPSLSLTLLPLVAHRPYNQPQHGQNDAQFQVQPHSQQTGPLSTEESGTSLSLLPGIAGCTIRARDKQTPYHILAVGHPESLTQFLPTGVWYWHFLHRHDKAAGLPATDDLYLPGVIRARLWPRKDSSLTIVVTTEELASLPLSQNLIRQNYEQALDRQRGLLQIQSYFGEGGSSLQTLPTLPLTHSALSSIQSEEFLRLLYQAGDRLLVRRTLPYRNRPGSPAFFFRATEHIPTIIPGYYRLEDNTREALIALPGLCVTTRRYSEAQRMLRSIGRYFRQGLLPSRLPSEQRPDLTDEEYNSVDTTLWYFYALDAYLSATHDYELLDELYPRLVESVSWYTQGTYHGIQVDPADGLLRTGSPERALTWMNALVQGKPVTPRTGKAVEVSALWYYALSLMYEWSHILYQRGRINHTTETYKEQADLCRCNFNKRFWYQDGGYLYDLIDGPHGNDHSLRPNQLLAGSLRYAVLDPHRQAMVLNLVEQQLVTPYGLRTLAPLDPSYKGRLPQNHEELQYALHQGGAWPWLIGPYIDAMFNLEEQGSQSSAGAIQEIRSDLSHNEYVWRKGLQILEPFRQQMQNHLLGSISDVYDGDAPQNGGPRPASAISIGEILRIYKNLAHMGVQYSGLALSV